MHQVQLELTDQLYNLAKRRAVDAGFKTVHEYVVGLVSHDLIESDENLDHLFTPGRIAHIDSVIAKLKAGGKVHTVAEVRKHFSKRFEG